MQHLVTPKTSIYNTGSGSPPMFTGLTAWTVMMGLWRPLLNILLTNLRRRENTTLRKWWSCRNDGVAEASFRKSRNWTMMSENGLNATELSVHYTRKTAWISHYWDCTRRSLMKNDPHLCNFKVTHYLNKQVKSIKDPPTCAWRGPCTWHGRGCLWQVHPRRWWRQSWVSGHSHGGGEVTKQDPMGSSWDRPLPRILCCSSPLKYLDNSIWCTFPRLTYRC